MITQKASNQLLNLIDVIKNPDVYQQKLNELVNLQANNEKTLKKITKAKDIDALYKKAEEANLKADDLLTQAAQEASKTLSEAEEKAASILAKAQETASYKLKEAEGILEDAISKEKDIKKREKAVEQESTQNKVASQALQKAREDLNKKQAIIDENLKVLGQIKTI